MTNNCSGILSEKIIDLKTGTGCLVRELIADRKIDTYSSFRSESDKNRKTSLCVQAEIINAIISIPDAYD